VVILELIHAQGPEPGRTGQLVRLGEGCIY